VQLAHHKIGKGIHPDLQRVQGEQAEDHAQDRGALPQRRGMVAGMNAALAQQRRQAHQTHKVDCKGQRHHRGGHSQVQEQHHHLDTPHAGTVPNRRPLSFR